MIICLYKARERTLELIFLSEKPFIPLQLVLNSDCQNCSNWHGQNQYITFSEEKQNHFIKKMYITNCVLLIFSNLHYFNEILPFLNINSHEI